MCRTAKKLRFESLRNISRVVQIEYHNKNPSKSLVKRILYKHGIKSFKRKRKPFVTLKKIGNTVLPCPVIRAIGQFVMCQDVVFFR